MPTVQQMFATLLGEIATLRRQNEAQQRQLEHLRSTTSLLLERDNVSLQSTGRLQFKHLPSEIREMIWELAIPSRLLGFKGIKKESGVPSTLSVPAVACVCRESRRVFMARTQHTEDSAFHAPNNLWRLLEHLLARWTSFRPHTDTLLINPSDFLRKNWENNYPMATLTEHIVVDSWLAWSDFVESGFKHGDEQIITRWVRELGIFPDVSLPIGGCSLGRGPFPTGTPVCHLRTVDFAMYSVTKVDQNYPPNLVHRLFGGDSVKIVDLRDRDAVDEIKIMIHDEVSPIMEPSGQAPTPTDLEDALDIFKAVATNAFPNVQKALLTNLVQVCYNNFPGRPSRRGLADLPSPLRDGKLDMEVMWVKEFLKPIRVRPVHVFVRVGGMSHTYW